MCMKFQLVQLLGAALRESQEQGYRSALLVRTAVLPLLLFAQWRLGGVTFHQGHLSLQG